jgi:hypothetical protein
MNVNATMIRVSNASSVPKTHVEKLTKSDTIVATKCMNINWVYKLTKK